MKHSLFVGHFDESVRSWKPKVIRPVDLERVRLVLVKHCDKDLSGRPVVVSTTEEFVQTTSPWLGRIEQEDVSCKDGYLICPWLSAGANQGSLRFIAELHSLLGVQIYEPGDGVYFTLKQLIEVDQEAPKAPASVKSTQ